MGEKSLFYTESIQYRITLCGEEYRIFNARLVMYSVTTGL
jgi:hypothetical protein